MERFADVIYNSDDQAISKSIVLALVVPLLALPQSTHYVPDDFI